MRSVCVLAGMLLSSGLFAQSLGNAGTVQGTVLDPSGLIVVGAAVRLQNSSTGHEQNTVTDADGAFRLTNVPLNPYHLSVKAKGFANYDQEVTVRSGVALEVKITLAVATAVTQVEVHDAMIEEVPYAHADVSNATLAKLPTSNTGSGMSDAITAVSGSVVADSNGFFHPLGDHGQTSFQIDGEQISDQQSKAFSTSIPLNAIDSMELITGMPNAEFGDKTSLVVNATTKSGLGQKFFGSFTTNYGSFGTVSEETGFGFGNAKLGNFISIDGSRTDRFLDPPEFAAFHDKGNNSTFFDRFDYQPNGRDAFHVNLFLARNWFQIPDSYDQLATNQDQRQQVETVNVALGYQHTFGNSTLLTINPSFRRDVVGYYPSDDPFDDSPATLSQHRTLSAYAISSDMSMSKHHNEIKFGMLLKQTRLDEAFTLGVTDYTLNPVCLNGSGVAQALPTVTNPAACAGLGFQANPGLLPGLVPFDLTRGGALFRFSGSADIDQYAFYAQDAITLGSLTFNIGLRLDEYDGITQDFSPQPRAGASYHIKKTKTVVRASFSRTMETPYNENLVLSSTTGSGGLAENIFGAFGQQALRPGNRNQYNVGMQQGIGRYIVVDGDYFWKFTRNAYDFDVLFNTPITFPISWYKSKIDGVSMRVSSIDLHGFQWYTTLGHTRARYFPPETGGIIFNSPIDTSVFRIDHDQALQATTNLRYQPKKNGPWVSFIWRYDSGLVAGSVTDLADALALDADQQAAIGFYCGSQVATLGHALTSAQCNNSNYGATRIVIPKPGTENPDTNPPRVAPRNLLDASIGTDNLFKRDHYRTTLRLSVTNLTNKEALYNFLSTFSGTHFIEPRAYTVSVGFVF